MADIYLITHPDVMKDPAIPVPRWPLSARGRARVTAMLTRSWVRGLTAVYCSDEQKALDGAAILAGHLGLTPIVMAALGEVDRSSTGFLPEAEHATAARQLFERSNESIRGWETACHAQARFIAAMDEVIQRQAGRPGDVAVVAHGAVGTFYLCHLKGAPISLAEAQPGRDGGHYYCFDAPTKALRHGWVHIEQEAE